MTACAYTDAPHKEMMVTDERPDDRAAGADDTTPHEPSAWDEGAAQMTDPLADSTELSDEPSDGGRPRWPVVIGLVLLLAVIGGSLAMLLPSGPVREVDQLIPTAPAGQSAVPTALPLPVAVEGDRSEVIATVGDGSISRGDFISLYQPGADPQELLDQLIQVELLIQAASTEGVRVDEAAVTEQLAQIKEAQANGDEARFQDFLEQQKLGSEENLRRLLARNLVVEQMILRHTTGEQVRARHILIATETVTDTAVVEAARVEAEALMAQLDGGADFAALAAEHSDDEFSAVNGGDLGWALRGLFVEPFDEAVFSMARGERRLVQSQFGWHIIELLDPPEVRPLESRDLLQTQPGQQAFVESFLPYLEQLQASAEQARQINILVPAEQLVAQP